MKKTAFQSSALTIGLLLGRVIALVGTLVLADHYGFGGLADSVILITILPYWLAELLMNYPFSAAFIPLVHDLGLRRQKLLFKRFVVLACCAAGIAMLVLTSTLPLWVRGLAPGLSDELLAQLAPALRITLLALPVLALTAVVRTFLQAQGRHALVAFEHAISNAIYVLGVLFILPHFGLKALAVFVVLGACVRLGPQAWQLWRGMPKTSSQQKSLPVGYMQKAKVWPRYFQSLSVGALMIGLPFIGRSFASLDGAGSITLFTYALQILGVPLWVVRGVFPTLSFPLLCEMRAHDRRRAYRQVKASLFGDQTVLVLLLTLAMAWFFIHTMKDPIALGSLSTATVSSLAALCLVGVLSFPFQALTQLMVTVLNARKASHLYLRSHLLALVLAPLAFFFGQKWAGVMGVFIAMSLTHLVLFTSIWLAYVKSGESLWFSVHKRPIIRAVSVATVLLLIFSSFVLHFDWAGRALLGIWVFVLCFGGALFVSAERKKTFFSKYPI